MTGRRRLIDTRSSYERTGIACGNPQRYGTRETLCMDHGLGNVGSKNAKVDPVEQGMETEGQLQLQALLKQQLNTKLTMKEQVSQHREFTGSGPRLSAATSLKGVMGLSEYQAVVNADQQAEELQQCGLDKAQIKLKLDCDTAGASFWKRSRFGMEPGVREAQIKEIEAAIDRRQQNLNQPDTFFSQHNISRHKMELERSVVQGDPKSYSLSRFLLRQTNYASADAKNPISHLSEILSDIEQPRRKKLKHETSVSGTSGSVVSREISETCPDAVPFEIRIANMNDNSTVNDLNLRNVQNVCQQKDDREGDVVKSVQKLLENRLCCDLAKDSLSTSTTPACRSFDSQSNSSLDSNKLETLSTSCETFSPRTLSQHVEFIPSDVIKRYRLSAGEIKDLPKFKDYTPGALCQVLYVKNLTPKVTELDLVALFGRFEKPDQKISYRLMTGKMRGQAFITFDSTETATEALNLIHGYHFKGKPIIIQYGRQALQK